MAIREQQPHSVLLLLYIRAFIICLRAEQRLLFYCTVGVFLFCFLMEPYRLSVCVRGGGGVSDPFDHPLGYTGMYFYIFSVSGIDSIYGSIPCQIPVEWHDVTEHADLYMHACRWRIEL